METPILFSAYLIDPYLETIELVETTDSLASIARLIGTGQIGFFCQQPDQDLAIAAAEAMPTYPHNSDYSCVPGQAPLERTLIPRAPAWQWLPTIDIFYGRALWVKLYDQTSLQTPSASRTWLSSQIEFWGFAHVVDIGESTTYGSSEGSSVKSEQQTYFEDYMLDNAEEEEEDEDAD
jgi:hypothetical protein